MFEGTVIVLAPREIPNHVVITMIGVQHGSDASQVISPRDLNASAGKAHGYDTRRDVG